MNDEKVVICNVKVTKRDKTGEYEATGKLKGVKLGDGSVDVLYRVNADSMEDAEQLLYRVFAENKTIKIPEDPQLLMSFKSEDGDDD